MVFEVLGWFGAIVVLAGYALFSLGKIANGALYQWTNLIGGLAVSINVSHHGAYPSMIVNTIWALIAAVVLVRLYRRRHAAAAAARAASAAASEAEEARVAPRPAPTTASVPLVESVPVITAALAVVTLAAVAHAAEQQAVERPAEPAAS